MLANRFLVLLVMLPGPVDALPKSRITGAQRRSRGVRGLQQQDVPTTPAVTSSLPTASPPPIGVIDIKKVKGPPKVASNAAHSPDFAPACVAQLTKTASETRGRLTNVDYGTFVLGFCSQSPKRGSECDKPAADVGDATRDFTSLPVQLQLAFARPACSSPRTVSEYDQLQCLADLLERGEGVFAYVGDVDELCQQTSTLLAPTRLVLVQSPTVAPSTVPIVPSTAPTPVMLPYTMEGIDSTGEGGGGDTFSDGTESAQRPTVLPSGQSSPTTLQESMESDGSSPMENDGAYGSWPSSPSGGGPPNDVDPAASGRRRPSAGPIVAAVLIGASLGGLLVTALWLRHKVHNDKIRREGKRSTCTRKNVHGDDDDDDDDDDDGLLGSGNGSVPSEHSCEIYLMEPTPVPPKSKRTTADRWGRDTSSTHRDEEESEITIEFHKEVASEVPDDASQTWIDPVVLPQREPSPAQSPATYISVHTYRPSSSKSLRDDVATSDNLQLSPISALSESHHGPGAVEGSEDLRVHCSRQLERPGRQATGEPAPVALPTSTCRWKPVPSRVSRPATTSATLPKPSAPPEKTAEVSSPAVAIQSPTAATTTDEEQEDVEARVAVPSVLKMIQHIEKELMLSPQTPNRGFERHSEAVLHVGAFNRSPHITAAPLADDVSGLKAHSYEAQPIAASDDALPDHHFVLDPIDSPEVTSDVSDAESADENVDRDDDWTEETVSLEHAEMEISDIIEDRVASDDDASFEEEVVIEEFDPIIVDEAPRVRVLEGWPKRRIQAKQAGLPATLFLPPLVGKPDVPPTDTADGDNHLGRKPTVKDLIAAYSKSPTSPYGKSPTSPSGAAKGWGTP